MRHPRRRLCATLAALAVGLAAPVAGAQIAVGDLDGDGVTDRDDESLLIGFLGTRAADPGSGYDAAADLNGDGRIDLLDLALLGAALGRTGEVDATPPELLVTLNDIPAAMNARLAVPPDGFQITLHFDSAGGSAVDVDSLSVTGSRDIGPYPAGAELAPLFTVTPTRAVWTVPPGTDLARTRHTLTAHIDDYAGNRARDEGFDFAVRDFAFGPPMGNLQRVYLDFDGNRGPGSFTEDLRAYGLASDATPAAAALEPRIRALVIDEIVRRVGPFYGIDLDGRPGPDAANVVFTSEDPGPPRARLCVGGDSEAGGPLLGTTDLDPHNFREHSDDCSGDHGVFPPAMARLWSTDPDYRAAFDPVDPARGGQPIGEAPGDALLLDPDFDPRAATPAQRERRRVLRTAIHAFAQALATVIAHEAGHAFGLVSSGPVPKGLYGGGDGPTADHNVTPEGATPSANFLMNAGGSFRFGEVTGRGGFSLPTFRPLNWAYLRDRVVIEGDAQPG
jgi:hypothetical protein